MVWGDGRLTAEVVGSKGSADDALMEARREALGTGRGSLSVGPRFSSNGSMMVVRLEGGGAASLNVGMIASIARASAVDFEMPSISAILHSQPMLAT